ncbi:hypothetical protein J3E69DRAFT_265283 [Trichoderma sp. SZMC 28015]
MSTSMPCRHTAQIHPPIVLPPFHIPAAHPGMITHTCAQNLTQAFVMYALLFLLPCTDDRRASAPSLLSLSCHTYIRHNIGYSVTYNIHTDIRTHLHIHVHTYTHMHLSRFPPSNPFSKRANHPLLDHQLTNRIAIAMPRFLLHAILTNRLTSPAHLTRRKKTQPAPPPCDERCRSQSRHNHIQFLSSFFFFFFFILLYMY